MSNPVPLPEKPETRLVSDAGAASPPPPPHAPKPPFFKGIRDGLRDNGALVALFSVVFVNMVGFGIVMPLLPFFAEHLNAGPFQVALMFSAYSLGQFFAEPLWGWLSDRMGRKPVLLVTTASNVLFYVALALCGNIWLAIFIRFLSGLGSGNISTIQGYISDMSEPHQRASRMSLLGAAFSLGFIIGPFIGGILARDAGNSGDEVYALPLYAAAVMAGLAALGVVFFVKESRPKSHAQPPDFMGAFKEAKANPVISRVIIATLCYMGAFAGLESIFALWAKHRYNWGPQDIGMIFLCIGITAAIMQVMLTRRLVRLYGEAKVMAGGLALFGASFILQGANQWAILIAPIVMFGTVGQAVVFSNISALISKAAPPDRQGAMLGFNMSMGAVARILGPILAGFLFSRFGPDAPILMGAVLCLPAAWMALQVDKAAQKMGIR
ncbi:MFS transporter [Asticcacaulis machinosus]|uniref:MFS transporter n=1 Tax=Asticcacaulis machinosus TaxID=2984211 RepID=A0ABT5HKH1_9CAUL|nr:MFS transporter [Asticcacaulis machinosus]MDC7676646.1 MFS transporter [Asticcacaulis machinosus]